MLKLIFFSFFIATGIIIDWSLFSSKLINIKFQHCLLVAQDVPLRLTLRIRTLQMNSKKMPCKPVINSFLLNSIFDPLMEPLLLNKLKISILKLLLEQTTCSKAWESTWNIKHLLTHTMRKSRLKLQSKSATIID